MESNEGLNSEVVKASDKKKSRQIEVDGCESSSGRLNVCTYFAAVRTEGESLSRF